MIAVDTSIWIEFFKDQPEIVFLLKQEIRRQKILAVGCIFAELLQGVKNQRELKIIKDYWTHLPKLDETHIWVEVGYTKGIGLIDAFLLTYCKTYKTKIWSLDKKMLSAADKRMIYTV